ncbi:MAG: gliding motility-associated transporter substrate-binding protein GldG [Bacteroidota bacterium]|jgi:gliding-associated putative ABC transporter substrate-binding component GldG
MNKLKSFQLLGFVLVLVVINILADTYHTGIDLTAEKRFTLSATTKKLVQSIRQPMTLTVYLDGNLPAGFQKLANRAEDVASAFRSISKGNFLVEFERPGAGLSDTAKAILFDSLQMMGIHPTNVKAQQKDGEKLEETLVFPGAVLSGKNGQVGLDFLEGQSSMNGLASLNNAEALMEFKIARAIMMLQRDSIPIVGYLTGNGQPLDYRVYDLVENVLRKDYYFKILPIDSVASIPMEFKAIVVAKPTRSFSRAQRLKIDQYVMRGGKIIWAVDQLYASMDSLQRSNGSFVAYDQGLDLDEQLFKYGVRINRDLVQDLESDKVPSVVGSMGGQPQIELLPWPYAPLLRNTNGHPIAKNLDFVSSSFPQSIDTIATPGIAKQVLLTTSNYARSLQTPALVEWRSVKSEQDLALFNQQQLPVAMLLEGTFRSAFGNRLSKEELDTLAMLGVPFQATTKDKNSMVVLSDGDILLNPVNEQEGPLAMGMNSYTRQPFANRDFISNVLFYLTGGEDVIAARSKIFRLRLIDKDKMENDKLFWQALNIVLPLLLLVFFYFANAIYRKKKYAGSLVG